MNKFAWIEGQTKNPVLGTAMDSVRCTVYSPNFSQHPHDFVDPQETDPWPSDRGEDAVKVVLSDLKLHFLSFPGDKPSSSWGYPQARSDGL